MPTGLGPRGFRSESGSGYHFWKTVR